MTEASAGSRVSVGLARMPASERAHQPFLIASLSLAVLIGFVLGIHVPLDRLLNVGSPERTADLIQAHGQVQLVGFAGLFVIGMSLRLMPRFASSHIAFEPLVPLTLWLLVAGLFTRAVVMPWFDGAAHAILLIAAVFAVLLGSACFLLVVGGTLSIESRRFDSSSLAFFLGALLFFGASVLAAVAAIDAVRSGSRSLPYLVDGAVLHLELFGFLLSFILGVALRTVPPMVGVARPGRSAGAVALFLAGSTAVLAGSLLYIEYVEYAEVARILAGLGLLSLGLVLLMLVWQAGVLRQAANRIRPASQLSLWLLRSAFVWMTVAGIACLYYGAKATGSAQLPSQTDFDAVRHAMGVGVVTILIVGMALMILPEFAGERQAANRQSLLAILLIGLLNVAALLRVLPSMLATHLTPDERNLSMALAGSLAETALILFAGYLFRLLWRQRRAEQAT